MSEQWRLPRGYRFAGVHAGVRPEGRRKDLALVVSDRPAAAAGVFTQNRICAAPVQVSRARVPSERVRGIIICSGNANACTGEQGLADAREMTDLLGQELMAGADQVLVASTGIIGRPLPMTALRAGVPKAFAELAATPGAFEDAARAILTTDTCIKIAQATVGEGSEAITLLGFAKGAAMIGPNMATLLAFVLTDAAVSAQELQALLTRAAERSFNCISVEGHMSTNDTLLARGPPRC
jgi:glutamate N-acetyltransferase/amino-acid N-acetyltransferase